MLPFVRRYSKISKMAIKVGIIFRFLALYSISLINYQTISSKDAGSLDKDLMEVGSFSLDQLMELAGLSVSQAGMTIRC